MALVSTSQLYLWYMPPTLVTTCFVGVLLGKLRLTQVNILRVSVYVVILSLMVIFYLLGRVSVRNFTAAFLVSSWSAFFLAVAFVIKRGWIGWTPSLDATKKLLGYGIKVHIGSLAGILNLRLDQLLLSIFLPPTVLGLYVVAVTVGSGASLVALTIASWVAFPRLSNLPSGALKAQTLGRFMRVGGLATLFSVAILFIAAPWIITFFFGAAYGESVNMARILILAAIPLGCNAVFTAGFKAYDLPAVASSAEVVGLAVMALGLLILLPNFQAVGAAWASLLAYSVTFVYMLKKSHRKMNMRLDELFLFSWDDWRYLRGMLARTGLSRLQEVK
jgi:O-antigen/teichoic acid export membrane protein